MAFKQPTAHVPVPESPDQLFRDLPRRKLPSLYDHQGQMLRTYVSKALKASDVALQLPTGSGKTLVGLLLAEWRRRKYSERVVYLCPTRQLVYQVAEEAKEKYGLSVETFTGKIRNYSPESKSSYIDGKRIAVTTYNSLFNTNPFFENPDVIIVDDAHAAENYIAKQWTFQINRSSDNTTLFHAITGVIKSVLSNESYARLSGGLQEISNYSWVDKIPTGKIMQVATELREAISAHIDDHEQRFAWSMIADHLPACQLYISCSEVMIRPLIPPTWNHAPFSEATQRIFMSATLGAGGDLERLTGRSEIVRLPVPAGWDRQGIGRRFFIFPEKSLIESDVVSLRHYLMEKAGRSLVLTPSNESAEEIAAKVTEALGYRVFNAGDLESSKANFIETEFAVAVVANRYDGIDFPNDDCRLLFVEGLPRAMNLQERFLMNKMGANLLFNERVQTRILQAIGRCTRDLNDYSAVVVTGDDLPAYLTDRKRRGFFHPELQAELEFGVEQSSDVTMATIKENFGIFLQHESEWEEANEFILEVRAKVTQTDFPAMDELANVVRFEINWQKAMWNQDYTTAYEAAREVLGGLNNEKLRGYRALWHYLAGSAAELASVKGYADLKSRARQQFMEAKKAAAGIPWLVALAHNGGREQTPEEQNQSSVLLQVERLEAYLEQLGTLHNRKFSEQENKIRAGLNDGSSFEKAQVYLGQHLGYAAAKRESDASPDPWWFVGDIVIVFEDHANAKETTVIDATKARQAASHPDWIRKYVPGASDARIVQSVLVTPCRKAKQGAMPHLERVAYWDLDSFRKWGEQALVTVRDLRRCFREAGDLAWRAKAVHALTEIKADAPGLAAWLAEHPACDHLQEVS